MAEDGEAVLDSWEDLDDKEVLDQKLKELKPSSKKTKSGQHGTAVVHLRDETMTQYQPQVKILQRKPDSAAAAQQSKGLQKTPMKSLEQREAEYAEARQRILGSTGAEQGDVPAEKPSQLLSRKKETTIYNPDVVRQPIGPDGSKGFILQR